MPGFSHIKPKVQILVTGVLSSIERERERDREMAATSQATLNQQALFEDQEMPTQMGFFSFSPHLTYPQSASCHQSLKGFIIPPSLAADAPSTTNLTETLLLSSATNKQREDTIASDFGGPHLLSLQRSGANLW